MTLRDDVRTGLLLAEGLGACARIAVDARVSERSYLQLARSLYRKLAGEPRGGRPAASHGSWDPLLGAVGGIAALARECIVARRTAQRWVSGQTVPDGEMQARIARLARRYGVGAPLFSEAVG